MALCERRLGDNSKVISKELMIAIAVSKFRAFEIFIGDRADKPGFNNELIRTERETATEASRRTAIDLDRVRSFH
jgi:hypothetical protein